MDTSSTSFNKIRMINIFITLIVLLLNINIKLVNAETVNNLNKDIGFYFIYNEGNFFDEIYKAITGKVTAYKINIDNQAIGYFSENTNFKNIKNLVLKYYLEDIRVNENLVLDFNIKGNINISKEKVYEEVIEEDVEIAKKIYELSKSNNISLSIKYLQENILEIKPSTIILPTEEMFLGESKTINGKPGIEKKVYEISLENNSEKSRKLVKDDIAKEAISTKIYRGTKNPYEYGIAFLNQPTRGGYLTSGYGERWESFHKGIDISGNIGDDVLAALEGEVVYAEYNDGGYGNLIILEHENNMKTFYGHLNDFYVKVGDKVNKGDVIGAIGNTGFSTGPHLHFELRVNNNPVDPYEYIIQ